MKRIFWVFTLASIFVLTWSSAYAGDFYVIPGMKKNFAPVQKTGQQQCYEEDGTQIPDCSGTGQDGDHQKGIAWPEPRFTDNGDGTVTDKLTGLIWLKDGSSFGTSTWTEALNDCNCLSHGESGLTDLSVEGDWRLPNRFELESLLDLAQYNPSLPIGHYLSGNLSGIYWSSSTYAYYPGYAWYVNFYYGNVGDASKNNGYYVRCVRSGR